MAKHELKTIARYWDAVNKGEKLFQVRKNDRFFQAGDTVVLLRLHDYGRPHRPYSDKYGNETGIADAARLTFRVGPILQGGQFGIEPGYCVFSLLPAVQETESDE
jgi:hypothetical protein